MYLPIIGLAGTQTRWRSRSARDDRRYPFPPGAVPVEGLNFKTLLMRYHSTYGSFLDGILLEDKSTRLDEWGRKTPVITHAISQSNRPVSRIPMLHSPVIRLVHASILVRH